MKERTRLVRREQLCPLLSDIKEVVRDRRCCFPSHFLGEIVQQRVDMLEHVYGHSPVAFVPADLPLQPTDGDGERRNTQVRLGLAATGWEPEQVGDRIGLV